MFSDSTASAKELQDKLAALEQLLLAYGRVAIGFSGGVDSSFLAAVCSRIMPANTLLVHLTTPLIGTPEQASFERSVDGQANGGPHFKLPVLNLSVDQLQLPQVACNDADRCYHCKRAGFTAIVNHAKSLGFPTVIDGSNASDRGDYRPGMRAAQELGVRSPLMEVGFTKDEERELLRAWDYPVWNLPAGACLATRVPTGEELTREKVDVIRTCEDYLHDLAYRGRAVRCHQDCRPRRHRRRRRGQDSAARRHRVRAAKPRLRPYLPRGHPLHPRQHEPLSYAVLQTA